MGLKTISPAAFTTQQYRDHLDQLSEQISDGYLDGLLLEDGETFTVSCGIGLFPGIADALLERHCEQTRPLVLHELRRLTEWRIVDQERREVLKELLALRPISKRIDQNDF